MQGDRRQRPGQSRARQTLWSIRFRPQPARQSRPPHEHEDEAEVQIRLNGANKNLILVNYESLPKYEAALIDLIDERTILVFDEIHKIKGITSKRAQNAKRIAENAILFILTLLLTAHIAFIEINWYL